jgi:hypothetical protein
LDWARALPEVLLHQPVVYENVVPLSSGYAQGTPVQSPIFVNGFQPLPAKIVCYSGQEVKIM